MKYGTSLQLLVALCGVLVIGCSTKLTVKKIDASREKESRAAQPEGLIVNRLATYAVEVKPGSTYSLDVKAKAISVVDPHHLLEVDYFRLPFASGKLILELTKDGQTVQKVGVSGTTAATSVVKAADTSISTATKIGELLAEPETP